MSKTIKVIELLNKIAKGENLPKKILYLDTVFYLVKAENKFYTYSTCKDEGNWERWINNKTNLIRNINETVLILDDDFVLIEEQQDIEIQGIEEIKVPENPSVAIVNEDNIQMIFEKLNEHTKALKQLDRKIKER